MVCVYLYLCKITIVQGFINYINYANVLYQYQNHVFQNIHKHKTMNLENNVIWFDRVDVKRIIKVIYKRVNIDSIFVLLIFLFFVCYVLCVLYILTDKCIKICNAINYQFFFFFYFAYLHLKLL